MEDKENTPFSFKKRRNSFKYAFNGFKVLFREEHNVRIHAVVAVIVVVTGFWLNISAMEWVILCFAIGFVIVTEILNSAIENLSDFVSPEYNRYIKKAKDLGAAAVLASSIVAVIIGLIVFLPKIF